MRAEVAVLADTSALAKLYLAETDSSRVQEALNRARQVFIDRIHAMELRSALSRRRRAGEITPGYEAEAWRTFQRDIALGAIQVLPIEDRHAVLALELVEAYCTHGLRPLDALHLAVAGVRRELRFFTFDRILSRVSADAGIRLFHI